MNRVIILQSKEDIVDAFKRKIADYGVGAQFVETGKEAFEIAEKQMPSLIVVDINIPDVSLDEVLAWFKKKNPKIHIKVIVDVIDPVMIAKLVNKYHVNSIYNSPLDIDQVVQEVKSALDEMQKNLDNRAEESIESEKADIEKIVESLKSKLRKQQKSYRKLSTLTKCFTDALADKGEENPEYKRRLEFVEEIFLTLLKMQTTGSFDVEKFDDDIRRELQDIKNKAYGFEVGEVKSCLFGGQSRAKAQNIRFVIYLIARLYSECSNSFRIDVDSHYITIKDVEFIVTLTFPDSKKERFNDSLDDYVKFVDSIIDDMTHGFRLKKDSDNVKYYLEFSV